LHKRTAAKYKVKKNTCRQRLDDNWKTCSFYLRKYNLMTDRSVALNGENSITTSDEIGLRIQSVKLHTYTTL